MYVKYDGDVVNGPLTSPCGLKYDVAIPLNALNHLRIKDNSDNDQSGTAVYTCNGAKIALFMEKILKRQLRQTQAGMWAVPFSHFVKKN